ncbi:MAG: DEAD/DEAH box helicase [Desulfopila sp.]|jgi:SNF2 family DNA or RNA helicase|nr:DEAD/DEAH box helicase [Desulfopila sp.]
MTIDAELLQKIPKLSQFEQTFLQFLSVLYEPAHSTLIVNCLKKLDLRGPRGNKPTIANLNHYITKLQKLGLLNDNQQCAEEIVEVLSKISVQNGTFPTFAGVIQEEAPVSYYYGKWSTRCWRAMRELRIGIYTQQFDLIDEATEFLEQQCNELATPLPPTVQVTTHPFSPEWFRSLPVSFQFYLLDNVFRFAQQNLIRYPQLISFLQNKEEFTECSSDEKLPFTRLLFHQLLFQGEIEAANRLIAENEDAFSGTGAQGTCLFLQGKLQKAIESFTSDINILKSFSNDGNVAFFGVTGIFHIMALLQYEDSENYGKVADQISIATTNFSSGSEVESYQYLAAVIAGQQSNRIPQEILNLKKDAHHHSLTLLFAGLAQYWLNRSLQSHLEQKMRDKLSVALDNGYDLIALAYAEILEKISHTKSDLEEIIITLRSRTSLISLVSILEPEEPWKRSLQALIHATGDTGKTAAEQDIRLVWMVDYKKKKVSISPREQKRGLTGEWSKGKPLSLARLYESDKLSYLSMQDRKVCRAISKTHNQDTHSTSFALDLDKALLHLIGHPLIFLSKSPSTPVEFIAGEPELLVEERGDQLHIRFAQSIADGNVTVFRDTPTRFKIISITENHRRIAQITGKDGLIVPKEASEQVLTAIGNISSFMTVHSAIAVDQSTRNKANITLVEADSTIYMHLLPYGKGFRLEMFVKPFAEGGHYLKPGQGVENLMAEVQGKRLQTRRNLALEEEKARDVEELCPILDLAIDMEQENDREWHLLDPDDCLQALVELQAISDRVVIEWPEGEKLSVTHQASFKNMNLKIRTNRQNWFSMSGHLTLDQDRIIDLKDLLARVKTSSGRFIKLGDGQFLALTQEFKKRLEDLTVYAEEGDNETDGAVLVHPLAALPLEDLTRQTATDADQGWHSQLERITEAQSFVPELPSTLQAELRDYQIEGFNWLARLSFLGVGGCLADDMGLGKTLQSLAIILKNAKQGPSLVVAPTSVSTNWQTEVNRFTPTLNLVTLPTKNRSKAIKKLGSFDLLITTYTLLQQEARLLSQVNWQTIILDEAQAIKNAATKRSKAAMSLKAEFKLITTGTPIENHLGELWNLFNFINPGLLGSINSFNEKYAIPIERFQDRDAKFKLKKLIRPFILRRIKSQVLEELPPRTDVTLQVEMSTDEAHFYEALRQNALDILESNKEKKGRHLQILTEIMKLRQACCNPRLISPDTSIESSKLKIFSSVVEELIGGRHKALVFSQFIGHLKIIREYLDAKKISYQYLDGSTPSRDRKQRVEDFQAGKGDLFLISLKAGGLGLNLTAADYVIHMDPWWNPAIEDQASDRAHRIGQTRPVTIYRLVCKNSIEEKIVKLHQDKRDLAGSLLEGSDISAKMSSDDLIDLIREG